MGLFHYFEKRYSEMPTTVRNDAASSDGVVDSRRNTELLSLPLLLNDRITEEDPAELPKQPPTTLSDPHDYEAVASSGPSSGGHLSPPVPDHSDDPQGSRTGQHSDK